MNVVLLLLCYPFREIITFERFSLSRCYPLQYISYAYD